MMEPSPIAVEVSRISIEPGGLCPLDAELRLSVDFAIDSDLAAAHWELRYVADHAHRRHVLDLGSTPPSPLAKGTHTLEHAVKDFGVSGLSKAVVLNVGLLLLTLFDGPRELLQISMVVQVLEQDEAILRLVLNPME
ncbi:hypothetical protein T492DRAFT_1085993, partial [Pavlovales sp. CCMP2436]|mmetsp:Transcript_7708/g.18306  ORF Transcript_7708/g.18306 Transcript_7708/m.18306 type:complete len:137 (+) Transcript_7708:3-413(+)